ncbi:MAG: DUF488 domain-containing protein [Phycisphaerae bacterium]|nr:DUF488 domain-containing protein [Phycisphaerae bacterium]
MNHSIQLFTVGFAGKSAEEFFGLLRQYEIRRVIDARLFNRSQLAGFAKRDDLAYFLRSLCNASYVHRMEFAPTKALLNDYKKGVVTWDDYEKRYKEILAQRQPQQGLTPDELNHACLLCAEAESHHCHRRLAAEYLQHAWPSIAIRHI